MDGHLNLVIITFLLIPMTSFGQNSDSSDTIDPILIEEPTPTYPGGYAEMLKYIKKNLRYPRASETVQGKVYVKFIVNEGGSLSDFRVAKGLADSFDNSALQVVKKMPNWIPAKRDNKAIRTKMVIPVTFD